jgi:hypothetical protein
LVSGAYTNHRCYYCDKDLLIDNFILGREIIESVQDKGQSVIRVEYGWEVDKPGLSLGYWKILEKLNFKQVFLEVNMRHYGEYPEPEGVQVRWRYDYVPDSYKEYDGVAAKANMYHVSEINEKSYTVAAITAKIQVLIQQNQGSLMNFQSQVSTKYYNILGYFNSLCEKKRSTSMQKISQLGCGVQGCAYLNSYNDQDCVLKYTYGLKNNEFLLMENQIQIDLHNQSTKYFKVPRIHIYEGLYYIEYMTADF